jgi:hypothetical protein
MGASARFEAHGTDDRNGHLDRVLGDVSRKTIVGEVDTMRQ